MYGRVEGTAFNNGSDLQFQLQVQQLAVRELGGPKMSQRRGYTIMSKFTKTNFILRWRRRCSYAHEDKRMRALRLPFVRATEHTYKNERCPMS